MRKKRLLKINCGRKMKGISAGLAILMLAGTMAGTVSAGNIADTGYDHYASWAGFATDTRDKTDTTSAYISHYGDRDVNVEVRSSGVNYTIGGHYYVRSGTWTYLLNTVKENGKNNCYLYITPYQANGVRLHGVWSPDSI